MLIQLLFTNTAHFALVVFSAFVFFAAGLLYFDSRQVNKLKKNLLLRSIGFFLLALTAAIHATSLEIPFIILFAQLLEISGLVLILTSLIREPILQPPHKEKLSLFVPFAIPMFTASLVPLSSILMLLIAACYFRKVTEGFEKQLKPTFIAFLFLGLSEALRIPFFWSDTPIVFWSKILAPFGFLWNIQHIFEFIGILILGMWVWGYIRFRLQVQLFVSTVALTLVLFLITTVFYTFLLLRNLETNALSNLKTDVKVLQYSLESVKERTLAHAQAVAQDSSIKQAFVENNKEELYRLSVDYMLAQKTNTLLLASSSGEVIMRAEDKDRTNDNVGGDPIVKSALAGKDLATVSYDEGVTVPDVSVKAAVPIREGGKQTGKIIGVVVTGITIDSAFVDGVKAVTGLDVAIFGKDKRAATTFIAPDGKSRFVGTLETNKKVLDTVLVKGKTYIGSAQVLNLPFYTAYVPLKSNENEVLGMLFVGKLQNTLTDAAQKSIYITFLGSIILIILSLIPAYFFSRFLKEHLEA